MSATPESPLIIDPASTLIVPRGPLVKPARVKWARDLEMTELIEYFDEPRFHGKRVKNDGDRFELLSVKEIQVISGIIEKCREDFSYAARNFFWITTKKGVEELFRLWESQELIYEKLMELKGKGLPMKVQILKARQLGSLHPDAKVLRANLKWDKIDNIAVGDKVIAVDEHSKGRGCGRRMRTATVLKKWYVKKEAFRISFTDGSSIVSSGDHPFLTRRRSGTDCHWITIERPEGKKFKVTLLNPGDDIRWFGNTWESKTSFEDGWFAGLLDGEGSYRAKHSGGIEICVSQVAGKVLERAKAYLDANGYKYRIECDRRKNGVSSKLGDKEVFKLVINSSSESMRLVGELSPSRFSGREVWDGKDIPQNGFRTIQSIESIGLLRMVDIETTTGTFIAEGLVTHNCSTLIEGLIAWKTMFFKNVSAIVVSYDAEHSAHLFGIMQYIYDRMPWWLKPQCSSREYKDGLRFENPDAEDRRLNPGLNSSISVQAANKRSGVGTGRSISAGHLSEYALWHPDYARDVIEQDIGNALQEDNPEMFCILESTARGAGTYSYRLWNKNVEMGDQAEWHPVFLPWFFESTRVVAPPRGWRPEAPEVQMNDRVQVDWLRCQYQECQQYHERYKKTEDRDGMVCPTCKTGILESYSLTPGQMYWMQRKRKNAEKEGESVRKLRQEQACITGDSMISSEKGILRIDMASSIKNTNTGAVSAWMDKGVREAGEIRTLRGRRITTTYDHKILLTDGRWVQAQDLRGGDDIVLSPPVFASEYYTVEWNVTPYVKSSIRIDETFGRFLGYFMGDGCWRGGGVNISCDRKDQDVVADARRVLEEVSGSPCSSRVQGGMEVVCSSSVNWFDVLMALGALRKNCDQGRSEGYRKLTRGYIRNVCVPDCIWRSPKSVVKEFLSALFECDGHGYRDSPKTTLFTCWEQFSRDVQLLLLGFGINAVVRSENKTRARENGSTRVYEGRTVSFTLEASNLFHKEVGFIGNRKRTTACVRAESKYTARRNRFRNEMHDGFASFCPQGEAQVYDISVPGANCFGANGLMVHNSTAEEAFQLSGIPVFGDGALDFVNAMVRPPIKEGFLDKAGKFHGCNPKNLRKNSATGEEYEGCWLEGCDQDHTYGDENNETPFHVWKEPEKDAEYCIGADVAEGLGGEADYSVGFVLRINKHGGADEQVAVFRSNLIDPVAFAQVLNWIGRQYNEALMAIEVNRYDTCMTWIRFQLQYPNLYRWKHLDSINPLSNKLGWLTQANSKPRLYQTLKRWLQFKLIILYSRNLASELKTFTKDDYDERGAGSESGSYDDEAIACMICLYCAHEGDWDDSTGQMAVKRELTMEEAPWHMACAGCKLVWPTHNTLEKQCPRCKCLVISGTPNRNQAGSENQADPFYAGSAIAEFTAGSLEMDPSMVLSAAYKAQNYEVETTRRSHQEEIPNYDAL